MNPGKKRNMFTLGGKRRGGQRRNSGSEEGKLSLSIGIRRKRKEFGAKKVSLWRVTTSGRRDWFNHYTGSVIEGAGIEVP